MNQRICFSILTTVQDRKNKLICFFFGRIYGSSILFQDLLTFKTYNKKREGKKSPILRKHDLWNTLDYMRIWSSLKRRNMKHDHKINTKKEGPRVLHKVYPRFSPLDILDSWSEAQHTGSPKPAGLPAGPHWEFSSFTTLKIKQDLKIQGLKVRAEFPNN